MGLPELKVASRDERSTDSIVKHILYTELSDNACFIVWNAKFLSDLMASFWGQDICRFDGSRTGTVKEKTEALLKPDRLYTHYYSKVFLLIVMLSKDSYDHQGCIYEIKKQQ